MTDSRSDPGRRSTPRLTAARALTCALALLGSACHSASPPSVTPQPAPDARLRLQQDVDALLSTPGLERSIWGVVVRGAESGETLYALNPGTLLMPASSLKVVTLAAAAERLGWDHVYETSLHAVGAIDVGYLDGDLVVVGSGDPSFDDWGGGAAALFAIWAERLKALGVRTIGGRIIGDDNTFDDAPWGVGWTWEDLGASYSAAVGALQINQNSARVSIVPASTIGERARVAVDPAWHDLEIDDDVTTSAAETLPLLSLQRLPGSPRLVLRGSLPVGSDPFVRTVSVDNPTLYFVQALREALVSSGIDVRGAAVDIDNIPDAPTRDEGVPLVRHRSPPLRELSATLMKNSQNLYAETLLKTIGGPGEAPASTEAGLQVVAQLLQEWGIPADAVLAADGSGLSRYNLATADGLASVLRHVHRHEYLRGPFVASLAIAGRDGTLARRMAGTMAEDRVFAKTGSFSNARSLAGYVRAPGGEPLLFVLMVNNFGAAGPLVESTMDAIVVTLAQFSGL